MFLSVLLVPDHPSSFPTPPPNCLRLSYWGYGIAFLTTRWFFLCFLLAVAPVTYEILVPQSRIEAPHLCLEMQSPNYWTTGTSPRYPPFVLPPSLSHPLLSPGACLSAPAFREVLAYVSLPQKPPAASSLVPAPHPKVFTLSSPKSLPPPTVTPFLVLLPEGRRLSKTGYGRLQEHRAAGTSPVVFQSLNPFQEGQPRAFLVTARGALRRVWFAEFLANKASYLHLEVFQSEEAGLCLLIFTYLFGCIRP